ncbi:AbiV family abortive infection protein [Adhaeribacter sp. BT258]|uniref:AbiV family abortive infection protein n=1 Tax=Adhaeribacter terrigena TaxID=2793070 RepID=A0ABS1C0Y9_9BACT|nr:AbiV family abortive infection protein [Adhaeribacter terrigena]MBK0403069.1 AbiV family abortive infection protein [Adhaeribacter terrigena]
MVTFKFENLQGEDCVSAYKALKANSKVLFETADNAAAKGNYGVARSLLILGSEEFIKGAILYLNSIGILLFKINDIRKALNNHKERHEVAMLIQLFKLADTFIQVQEYKPTSSSRFKWLNKALSILGQAKIVLDGLGETRSDLDWWDSANEFKNAGLYVDYKEQLLLPKIISESDYSLAKIKVKDFTKRFSLFHIFLDRAPIKERKALIKDLNDGINLYVSSVNKRNIVKAQNKASVNSDKELTENILIG